MPKYKILFPDNRSCQIEAESYQLDNLQNRPWRVVFTGKDNHKVAEFLVEKIVGWMEVEVLREHNLDK